MNISALSSKYCVEKGPNGDIGVWTRNGGNYAFFTPLSELEKQNEEKDKPVRVVRSKQETPEETYQRKINTHEWMG